MDDFIIFPDDKTMEKLAAEYSKIKAKTFTSNTEILSADNSLQSDSVQMPSLEKANFPYGYFLFTLIFALILKSIMSK